jgi:hypothetical protein
MPLVVRTGRENLHDAVQILNAGEFDTHASLADSERNLDIGVQAV